MEVKTFDVLNPNLDIYQNYLIEASAGTGKTFSIENIFLRLIVEKGISIENILVVTFTNKATNDLKIRIREKLEKALLAGSAQEKKIKDSLTLFDEANIFTIHKFCLKEIQENVFESNFRLDLDFEDKNLSKTKILEIIKAYFFSAINDDTYSLEEIDQLFKKFKNDIDKLQETLVGAITKGMEIEKVPNFSEKFNNFKQEMRCLKSEGYSLESIIKQFMQILPYFNKVGNKQVGIKADILKSIELVGEQLEKENLSPQDLNNLIKDGLIAFKALNSENIKKKEKENEDEILQKADFLLQLYKRLLPFVCPNVVFARMANHCQSYLRRYSLREESFGYDDILTSMLDACKNKLFVKRVRGKYKAVLVDEFQDTDPKQWEIIHRLFPPKNKEWGRLYLVGDPKQSIYAFRSADVYTYLSARDEIDPKCRLSLDTNYRSKESLVNSLNFLFSQAIDLMSLPKINQHLPYLNVKSGNSIEKSFSDDRKSVHFFVAEDVKNLETAESDHFFPFIVQEIQRLHVQDKLPLNAFAVLVSDRYQADRLAEFFYNWNIDCSLQKTLSLAEGCAKYALYDVIKAIENPKNDGLVKKALGGSFIRFTLEMIKDIQWEEIRAIFYSLQKTFLKDGFALFFQNLLQTSFLSNRQTIIEKILSDKDGAVFLADAEKVASACYDVLNLKSFRSILQRLDSFSILAQDEDERVEKDLDPEGDAVQIMTLHASKGLEFDVVFSLGLVKHSDKKPQLVPREEKLVPISDLNDQTYRTFCKEVDAEKMRLLYVAWTRAKYRLYAPVLGLSKAKKDVKSPMDIYLDKVGQIDQFVKILDKTEQDISYTLLNKTPSILKKLKNTSKTPLIPPKVVDIINKEQFINSFSSLNFKKNIIPKMEAPSDFNKDPKTPHTMPAGSPTGTLLHAILEKIPLENFIKARKASDINIRSYIDNQDYLPWENVISQMIFDTFKTPIQNGFCLSDIDPNQTFREIEFVYQDGDNFLKGFIDFVFFMDGKYYIIDWKSNWLGPSVDFYTHEHMHAAMVENGYFLQAEIYREAFIRYLKQHNIDEKLFGGVFYLFLRGIGKTGGVYKICY